MPALDKIIQRFQGIDRNTRLEVLLDYSRKLPDLPERFHQARDAGLGLVPECQTPTFLWVEVEGGVVRIYADVPREAPTVRGFLALLVKSLEGATPAEIAAVPADLLERLHLVDALGMTRIHGLTAILGRIKRLVASYGLSIGARTELPHSVQEPS
jgi:cysteine desulfuration protein SufE